MEPKEGRVSWVCGMGLAKDTQNYFHAHDYVDSWASKKAAEFLMRYYYYGHTNTTADLSVVSPGVVERARARRPDGPGPADGDPRVVHPTARRLPAVLERGAGVLTPANTGRR